MAAARGCRPPYHRLSRQEAMAERQVYISTCSRRLMLPCKVCRRANARVVGETATISVSKVLHTCPQLCNSAVASAYILKCQTLTHCQCRTRHIPERK